MTTETQEFFHEGTVRVCAHRVTYLWRLPQEVTDEQKAELETEAEDRALTCIPDGYIEGELNYESEELSCTGWWKINN